MSSAHPPAAQPSPDRPRPPSCRSGLGRARVDAGCIRMREWASVDRMPLLLQPPKLTPPLWSPLALRNPTPDHVKCGYLGIREPGHEKLPPALALSGTSPDKNRNFSWSRTSVGGNLPPAKEGCRIDSSPSPCLAHARAVFIIVPCQEAVHPLPLSLRCVRPSVLPYLQRVPQ